MMETDCRVPAEFDGEYFEKRLRTGYTYSHSIESGIYRNCLGTVLCQVCWHYTFQRDNVEKLLSWAKYEEITGHKLQTRMFWLDKTFLAAAQCPICGARYLLHCTPNLRVYNLSFFYSFAEQPAIKDVEECEATWFDKRPAPHLPDSVEAKNGIPEYGEVEREPVKRVDDRIKNLNKMRAVLLKGRVRAA